MKLKHTTERGIRRANSELDITSKSLPISAEVNIGKLGFGMLIGCCCGSVREILNYESMLEDDCDKVSQDEILLMLRNGERFE